MTVHRLIIPRYVALIVMPLLSLMCTSSAAKQLPERLDYVLEIAPNLTTITGQVCGEHLTQAAFTLQDTIRWRTNQENNQLSDNKMPCLHYTAQLSAQKQSRRSSYRQYPEVVSTSINDLLPCPVLPVGNKLKVNRTVALKLPAGMSASFPGKATGENRYSLMSRPCSWSSGVMLGKIKKNELSVSGSSIEVAMPVRLKDEHRDKLSVWLNRGISALQATYGRLPLDNFQILIFPTGQNAEAVPWGQVMRGGGDSVHLYVDETKSLTTLNADWVLVHELSHLLHPYLHANDGWLAEGIASYYQNVLRARTGLLDGKQAWRKLHAGFQRGLKQFEPHMTLEKNTRQMMRERKYMRVYWSGAAIALLADVQLRRDTNGKMSLDKVLENLSRCCLPTKAKRWRAKELMRQLDATAGTTIFLSLYEAYAKGATFPSLEIAYEELGITASSQGLNFDPSPQAMHNMIMQLPQ